LNGVPPL
jgi:hypothetical protein